MRRATAALLGCSENQHLWPFSVLSSTEDLFAEESKGLAPGRLLHSLIQVSSTLYSSSKLLKANRPGCPMNLERYNIFYAKEDMCYKHRSSKVNLKKFKRAYKEIKMIVCVLLHGFSTKNLFSLLFSPNTFENKLGIWVRRSIMF